MDGLGAGLGALGFWLFLAAVVVAGIWYGLRQKQAQHETLRQMIASGKSIDHTMMDKLLSSTAGGNKNLARDLKIGGLIVVFVGPGLAVLGIFIGIEHGEWLLPLLGVGALVSLVGIGLLVAAKAVKHLQRESDTSVSNRPAA
jgi:hypothetical protein